MCLASMEGRSKNWFGEPIYQTVLILAEKEYETSRGKTQIYASMVEPS